MDLSLILVWGLIALVGICLFIITGIFGLLVILVANIDRIKGKEYLKNITYGIFGGIIATILLELRGEGYKQIMFYIISLPMNLLVIFIFVLCGFWYLFLIDKLFDFLEKLESNKLPKDKFFIIKSILSFMTSKKVKSILLILILTLIAVLVSWFLANKFTQIHSKEYIDIIIQAAVFLAGFGLIAMEKRDDKKVSSYSVFFPNVKQIIIWSMLSILFSFAYLIYQNSPILAKPLFGLAVGFLFFTFSLVIILVLFHDNKYLKEVENKKQ
jgi:hypothetical protein